MTTRVSADRLCEFAIGVLQAAGMSAEHAQITGTQMVWRDLRDSSPIGVAVLGSVLNHIRAGGTDPCASPVVISDEPPTTVIDARSVWGQVAAVIGMRAAIEQARTSGVGVALVRNSSTANTMGYYPTLAIDQKMVGLAATNSYPLQAPWGGATKVLGNQAFAYGVPAGRHSPLLYDGSTTSMSHSRINKFKRSGTALPEGVALDPEGRPTTDPDAALIGSLLPMGGHKGYGLSVLWEVLTGVLAGGDHFARDVPSDPKEPPQTSLFLLAIDPAIAMPYAAFTERVDKLIDDLHSSEPAVGFDRVLAPGERGYAQAAEHERAGIPLPDARISELRSIGAELGVAW